MAGALLQQSSVNSCTMTLVGTWITVAAAVITGSTPGSEPWILLLPGSADAPTTTDGLTRDIVPLEVSMKAKGVLKSVRIDLKGLYGRLLSFAVLPSLYSSRPALLLNGLNPPSTRRMKPFKATRCSRTARPGSVVQVRSQSGQADWLGTRKRGTCRSCAGARPSLIGCLRKRSSSNASPLRTAGRGSGSGRSQPAAGQEKAERRKNRGGRSGSGAGEKKRGEARQEQGRAGAGFDSTIRLVSPQPSPSCPPSVLVRPQPLCLGRPVIQHSTAQRSAAQQSKRERDCLTD